MLEHLPIGWVFSMAVLLCPLAVVDWIAENRADMLAIWTLPAGVRVAVYATLFTYILLCGRVQGYEFIYAQF